MLTLQEYNLTQILGPITPGCFSLFGSFSCVFLDFYENCCDFSVLQTVAVWGNGSIFNAFFSFCPTFTAVSRFSKKKCGLWIFLPYSRFSPVSCSEWVRPHKIFFLFPVHWKLKKWCASAFFIFIFYLFYKVKLRLLRQAEFYIFQISREMYFYRISRS